MSVDKNHSEQFEKYLKGELSPQERHAFERDSLDDPFTQEALEGFEEQGIAHLSDIEDLRARVRGETSKRIVWWKYVGAAAVLLLASFFVFLTIDRWNPNPELSTKEELDENALQSAPKPDTIPMTKNINENDTQSERASVIQHEEEVVEEVVPEENVNLDEDVNYLGDAKSEEESLDQGLVLAESTDDSFVQPVVGDEVDLLQSVSILDVTESEPILTNTTVLSRDSSEYLVTLEERVLQDLQGRVAGVQVEETKAKKRSQLGASARSSWAFSSLDNISGQVTDESGEPLPGVTVSVKGTTYGAVTDIDGHYQLEKQENQTLIFSYIGFDSQEVIVGERDTVNVEMSGDNMELQEVVVTGYGDGIDEEQLSFTPASPKGGRRAYKAYLEEKLDYPKAAMEEKIEGTVVLDVTISVNGTIEKIAIKKSLGYGCDQEAIRLVQEGPKWNPATRNGISVSDEVKVKVKFKKKE